MGYKSDSSGTDDDVPVDIHQMEVESYFSVLRSFKAQSDALTWEKESLLTELRKELRISEDEHRLSLKSACNDDKIKKLRKQRKSAGFRTGVVSTAPPAVDPAPSSTVSVSRKRQKTSHTHHIPSLPVQSTASQSQQLDAPALPSLSAVKRGAPAGPDGKKMFPAPSTSKTVQCSSTGTNGRGQLCRNSSAPAAVVDPAGAHSHGSLIGRKVMTRWPDDNKFYEAVITDYNPLEGVHLLVYDQNTSNETVEWVNLREIKPEDIRWDGEDPGISRGGRGAPIQGSKKLNGRNRVTPAVGRGRGAPKNFSKKELVPSQNGMKRKSPDQIEVLHTKSLIKEVERVFAASRPDPLEINKAQNALKDHEQALINAIARLAECSDGESGKY